MLDNDKNRMAIITGPNMAGKSTYMRQVALICLMAQTGCFVPASYAFTSVVDRIFTRIGASDDIASGRSTFMVEMTEVAAIVKNATKKSLLILDEIGRGTSTFDGMSIAEAVIEFIADKKNLGAKTLFATHYHQLTHLEDKLDGIKNYNIAAKKRDKEIIFLRKIVKGGADDSFGIEVAALAGVHPKIIERAKEILVELEGSSVIRGEPVTKKEESQLSLGVDYNSEVIKRLKDIDLTTLSPLEALTFLFEMKKFLEE